MSKKVKGHLDLNSVYNSAKLLDFSTLRNWIVGITAIVLLLSVLDAPNIPKSAFFVVWIGLMGVLFTCRKLPLRYKIRKYEHRLKKTHGFEYKVSMFWANEDFQYSGIVHVLSAENGDGIESEEKFFHVTLKEDPLLEETYVVLAPIVGRNMAPGVHQVVQKGQFTFMIQPVV